MTLGEYWDLLSKHDWTYEYSDDHRVWKRGRANEKVLVAAASESTAHALMFDLCIKSVFSGPAYSTEQQPFPSRPTPNQEQALRSILSKTE